MRPKEIPNFMQGKIHLWSKINIYVVKNVSSPFNKKKQISLPSINK